jgi:hypothetical protein
MKHQKASSGEHTIGSVLAFAPTDQLQMDGQLFICRYVPAKSWSAFVSFVAASSK